jgi:hypothetical protein
MAAQSAVVLNLRGDDSLIWGRLWRFGGPSDHEADLECALEPEADSRRSSLQHSRQLGPTREFERYRLTAADYPGRDRNRPLRVEGNPAGQTIRKPVLAPPRHISILGGVFS